MTSMIGKVTWMAHSARHRVRRWQSRGGLPVLEAEDMRIVADLKAQGGCATSLDRLDVPDSGSLLVEGDRLMERMRALPTHAGKKSYVTSAPPEVIIDFPEIIRWGLDERLLAIADKARFNGTTRNFLGLLAQNGRARDLMGVIVGFERLYAKKTGVVAAEVVSAQPLSTSSGST